MSKNIVLIGFMGSGKSAVAKKLAQKLKLKFVDLDKAIEEKEQKPITEIFSQKGEGHFRRIEKDMVKEVSAKDAQVIACGGGVALDPENIANLRQQGSLIYLKASPEAIFNRTKGKKHRPLLNVGQPEKKIEELLKFREAFYAQADYTVETSNLSVEEVANEIIKILKR